jgi:hypothetical protein
MGNVNKVDDRTFFREHRIPSKRSFKHTEVVESMKKLIDKLTEEGYIKIKIDPYPPDRRRSYSRVGVVSWMDNYAVTGIRDGNRENIGYISDGKLL